MSLSFTESLEMETWEPPLPLHFCLSHSFSRYQILLMLPQKYIWNSRTTVHLLFYCFNSSLSACPLYLQTSSLFLFSPLFTQPRAFIESSKTLPKTHCSYKQELWPKHKSLRAFRICFKSWAKCTSHSQIAPAFFFGLVSHQHTFPSCLF